MTPDEKTSDIQIVAVKFRSAGKLYDFKAQGLGISKGDQVIVETDRGRALGTVVNPPRLESDVTNSAELKAVVRKATEADIAMALNNKTREREAHLICMQRIRDRKMDMKLVQAEYLYDGSKIIFYFTADGRVDFRELVKDLAHSFHTRIEMRQIGVRDEAKMLGGLGVCGRELCCSTFLRKFDPVSVKMAKEQGLALNPSKISGQCGRLLCCLGYEYKTYCSMRKDMPKCGTKVCHCGSTAEVIGQDVIGQKVTLRKSDKEIVKVPISELGDAPTTPEKKQVKESPASPAPKREQQTEKTERKPRPAKNRPRPQGRDRKKPQEGEKAEISAPPPKIKAPEPIAPKPEPASEAPDKESTKPRRRRPRRRKPRTES